MTTMIWRTGDILQTCRSICMQEPDAVRRSAFTRTCVVSWRGLESLFRPGLLGDRTGSGDGESRWTLGWCLTTEAESVADLSFGVKAIRRECADTVP